MTLADLDDFWERSDYATRTYVDDPLTPEKIALVEKELDRLSDHDTMTPDDAIRRLDFHTQPEPGAFLGMLRPYCAPPRSHVPPSLSVRKPSEN